MWLFSIVSPEIRYNKHGIVISNISLMLDITMEMHAAALQTPKCFHALACISAAWYHAYREQYCRIICVVCVERSLSIPCA